MEEEALTKVLTTVARVRATLAGTATARAAAVASTVDQGARVCVRAEGASKASELDEQSLWSRVQNVRK